MPVTYKNEIPNLLGTWMTDNYQVAFPENSDLFPTNGGKLYQTKIVINKQQQNLIWFTDYWKAVDEELWHAEKGTGVINLETNSISLVEAGHPICKPPPPLIKPNPLFQTLQPNPTPEYEEKPQDGSTGVFSLTPYVQTGKYQSCFNNDFYLTYEGLNKGISFSSILRFQGTQTQPLDEEALIY